MRRSSERGVALAIVLVAGVLVSLTAAIALNATGLRLHMTRSQVRHGDNYYASEAGVQIVWIKLERQIPPFDTDPGTWPDTDGDTFPDQSETIWIPEDVNDPSRQQVTITVNRISTNPDRFKISARTSP